MKNLQRNSIFLVLLPCVLGCATSFYKITKQKELRTELNITSDRIITECARVDEKGDRSMFLIHILDEKNTVLSAMQGNILDTESCEDRKKEINKILNSGDNIYLGGMGELASPRVIKDETYTFPRLGTFYGNGRVLQFMVIANERGDCYSAYRADEKPCPQGEFPIE